jgi:hypothetical protein
LNSVYGSRIEDFLQILCQGAGVFACSAKIKFPNSLKTVRIRIHKQKGIITIQTQNLKFHYLLPNFQTSLVKTNKKPVQHRLGMDGVGNGVVVAVETLQNDLDFVDVFWCAALEATRLSGVVDAGVRRHGGQAQGATQADVVESHLINVVFHCGNAGCRCVPGGVHLVHQLLHQRFQPVKLNVEVYSIAEQWRLVQS